MPAVVQHLADHVDRLDVASAGEMALALDTGMPPRRVSFAGPGKTDAELRRAVAAGVLVELESAGEARRIAAVGEDARAAAAGRGPGEPGLRRQGLGDADGRRAAAVRRRRRADAGHARAGRATSTSHWRASTSSPGRRTSRPTILVEAQRATVELVLALADKCAPPARRTSTSAAGSASRTPTRDAPLDLDRVGENLRDLAERRAAAGAAVGPGGPRARPVPGRRGRRLRHAGGRPQGLARRRPTSSSTAACTTSSPRPATWAR